ncbi:hypothetical protein BC835DRAFT_1408072 [Cytidiella melzeri]|nr:hypothetical protein BC835DRAFT_1408072 [Cytidiella melzeri]
MVYAVPIIVFMDDVSGNVSKQWNKHIVVYASNGNLSQEMIEKEFCTCFITSSPHASPTELMRAVRESISIAAETGVSAWDCRDEEEVLLLPHSGFFAGDNPMQAEECSHAGLACNFLYRTCEVGGTKAMKSSLEGYLALFKSGRIRTPQSALSMLSGGTSKIDASRQTTGIRNAGLQAIIDTVVDLGKQLRKPQDGEQKLSEAELTARLEAEFERLLNGHSLNNHINPLLGMPGVNIHLDTPTEILHTILLGIVKYFWGQTVFILEKSKLLSVLQSWMESISQNGLNLPSFSPDYMCRYRGSLIGKHFKSLAQVMPFLVYDLVPQIVVDGWNVIGELVVLLWHTTIEDREKYLVSAMHVRHDILILKPKFHFLI